MRDLRLRVRVYLLSCYVLGLGALSGLLLGGNLPDRNEWLLAGLLAAAAGVAPLFFQESPDRRYSLQVALAPIFAAILLLPTSLIAFVVCLALVSEWILYRRIWFMHLFKIASWLVASSVAVAIMNRLSVVGDASVPAWKAGTLLAGMVAFILVHTLLQEMTVKLGSDERPRWSRLFVPFRLASEAALLSIGWFFAFAWNVNPVYAVPASLPFLVIFGVMKTAALRAEYDYDSGTGILTISQLNAAVCQQLERARPVDRPVTLLACDVDLLSDVNNSIDHQGGNPVLQSVVDTIRHNIRGCDLTARFGSREFLIALPDVGLETGREIAERIREAFAEQRFPVEQSEHPASATVNVGIASFPEHGDSFETLFHEADLALFRAMRDDTISVASAGGESRKLFGEWLMYRGGEPTVDRRAPTGAIPSLSHARNFMKASNLFTHDLNLFDDSSDEQSPTFDSLTVGRGVRGKPTAETSIFVTIEVIFGIMVAVAVQTRHYPQAHLPWLGLALFVGLVLLANRYSEDIDARGTTAVAVVPIIAAGLLFNAYGILVATATFAIMAKLRSSSAIHSMLFNFGCMLLATSGAVLEFRALSPGSLSQTPFQTMLVPAVLAGLVFYLISNLFVCLIRSMTEHRNPVDIWREDYLWLWPFYGAAGLVGLTLGMTYEVMGLVVTLVMVSPFAVLHLAITRFVRRTSDQVTELRRLNRQLGDSYEATLQALSRALDTRDTETEEHSQRVKRYAELIGRRYGLSGADITHLARGALLHDIGKIGVPDAILLKPGDLSITELETMRQHPQIGYSMIAHIPFLATSADIVLHHHESFDGSGYPSGLAGEEIPLGARIFAVVDTLDAMTSDRPYRKALSFEDALSEIQHQSGRQFDPVVVDSLLSLSISELICCRDGVSWETVRERRTQPQGKISVVPA